jgi:hypothetical protein
MAHAPADAAFIAACSPDAIRELVGRCRRMAELERRLTILANFPVHPRCCPEDRSAEATSPPCYRAGWIDAVNAILTRTALHATPGEGT